MSQGTFSRRTVIILIAVCSLSLLTGITIGIFNEEIGVVRSPGSNTYSFSALGHHGFKSLLEDLDYPVLVSRNNSGNKTGRSGLLVMAEPDLVTLERQRTEKFWDMAEAATSVLVVLPKRKGIPDHRNPKHLKSVSLVAHQRSTAVLQALDLEPLLRRGGHSRDMNWDKGAWPDRPFINEIQLLESHSVEPLIATDRGILLGHLNLPNTYEYEGLYYTDIIILSDPDLLANHGLGQGNNAAIAVKMVDYLLDEGGTVVFDETLHGFEISPSVFRSFFRIPLVFVLLQVLLTAGAFLWLANGRFGSPRRATARQGRGLDFLINNTAELLEYGGHGSFVLGRYYRATVGSVCRRLHLELPQTSPLARERLVNISQSRSPDFKFKEMETNVPAVALDSGAKRREVLAMARALHRWQQEMTHGL